MKKYLIIANWKANPGTAEEAVVLARMTEKQISGQNNAHAVIAAPFVFLATIRPLLKKTELGAQDSFWSDGPHTGEISWSQLKNLGVKYVIAGHSERRSDCGETDPIINKKIIALLQNNIKAVLCVGERERVSKEISWEVETQIKNALREVKEKSIKNLIVAYEPKWAISSGKDAQPVTPADAHQAFLYIRKIISGLYGEKATNGVPIIYGGSVNSANARSFLTEGNMDGVLVGKSCLETKEFGALLKAVSTI